MHAQLDDLLTATYVSVDDFLPKGWMADRGAEFLRPDRKDEPLQFGSLGGVRQWIEIGQPRWCFSAYGR